MPFFAVERRQSSSIGPGKDPRCARRPEKKSFGSISAIRPETSNDISGNSHAPLLRHDSIRRPLVCPRFHRPVTDALLEARKLAVERCLRDITPEHVLFGIAAVPECGAKMVMKNIGLDLVREAMAVKNLAGSYPAGAASSKCPRLAADTERLLGRATEQARASRLSYVGTEHLVLGMLGGTGRAADYLREQGITPERFRTELRARFLVPSKPPKPDKSE